MTSNMPIENAAAAATSGPQSVVGSDGHVVLPTTEQLLKQATAQQQAIEAETQQPDVQVQQRASFTPAPSVNTVSNPTPTFDSSAQRQLMHSMGVFIKAQNRFLHDDKLPAFAGAMEAHIIALTTALEQLGVL
jgi:hypothetical protein